MAFYIKVRQEVADYLGVTAERNRTADGNVLLWQADVAAMPADTVPGRAAHVGGVALTAQAARLEIDGTDHPAETCLPEWLEQYTATDGAGQQPEVPDGGTASPAAPGDSGTNEQTDKEEQP